MYRAERKHEGDCLVKQILRQHHQSSRHSHGERACSDGALTGEAQMLHSPQPPAEPSSERQRHGLLSRVGGAVTILTR
jgi:hypothetical protein